MQDITAILNNFSSAFAFDNLSVQNDQLTEFIKEDLKDVAIVYRYLSLYCQSRIDNIPKCLLSIKDSQDLIGNQGWVAAKALVKKNFSIELSL